MTDVYSLIEKYSDLVVGIDVINAEKQALIDGILTPEIKQKIAEFEEEFAQKLSGVSTEKSLLEEQIKEITINAGQTIKGTLHQFVYNKGRVSWDTKQLDGYAAAHPEIEKFRKVGAPSVSVRTVQK